MGRSPCCSKEGLNRGAWTAMEDRILTEYIKIQGEGKWRNLPKRAGLKRCGKSCRLRWLNYLRPDIKRGNITHDEEELIIRLHKLLGNRWSLIAGRLPGRTDNEIKNYWNTNIGKKVEGHPNPTPKRPRPLNQSQENPDPATEGSDGKAVPKANTGSCVIRTKATRCTQVVITSGPQEPTQLDTKAAVLNEPSLALDPVDFSKVTLDEKNPYPNFMTDFEMGENFLSDFLNMDFSQLACLENEGDSSTNTYDKDHSSPKSIQTLLVSEDILRGSDFQSVAPLIESELDWL